MKIAKNKHIVQRTLQGCIISDKMDKTVIVLIERRIRHIKYKKFMKRSNKLHVHNENNIGKLGDVVLIKESRPISKKKSWKLVKIINQ